MKYLVIFGMFLLILLIVLVLNQMFGGKNKLHLKYFPRIFIVVVAYLVCVVYTLDFSNNLKHLKIVEKLSNKEIKKIILNEEKKLLISEILNNENYKKYRIIRDSLNDFPNEGEYKIQSLRLDSLVTEYILFSSIISKAKTTEEKEKLLKKYLEEEKLEPRYIILTQ